MCAQHNKTGVLGESAVRNHLVRKGFLHIESNFRAKTGEIDIILEKDGVVHFIEVKTVSRATYNQRLTYTEKQSRKVPHGTSKSRSRYVSYGTYRPEDNIHKDKLRKVLNTLQVWISLNRYEGEWQLDIAAVYLDRERKTGKIRLLENIIVE